MIRVPAYPYLVQDCAQCVGGVLGAEGGAEVAHVVPERALEDLGDLLRREVENVLHTERDDVTSRTYGKHAQCRPHRRLPRALTNMMLLHFGGAFTSPH